jgi:hypothetical protein
MAGPSQRLLPMLLAVTDKVIEELRLPLWVIRYRGRRIRMSGFASSGHELNCENVAIGQIQTSAGNCDTRCISPKSIVLITVSSTSRANRP